MRIIDKCTDIKPSTPKNSNAVIFTAMKFGTVFRAETLHGTYICIKSHWNGDFASVPATGGGISFETICSKDTEITMLPSAVIALNE